MSKRVRSGILVAVTLCVGFAVAEPQDADVSSGLPVAEPSIQSQIAPAAPAVAPDAASVPVPVNPMFYDKPLMLRQYGFGVVAGAVAGALGFYIGNAFEGAIFGSDSHKGYLSFTGIRYRHKRGPFWGGGTGLLAGSAMTVFFVGESDEEPGSVLWTVAGGALATAAAFYLADAAGVQEERGMLAFVPLLALPSAGAVGGYHVSRWFNDRKRSRVTGETWSTGPRLRAPRVGFAPTADGTAWRLDALNLTF